MCGIACVVGGKGSPLNCYKALEKLEYRGYDSAGIAILDKKEIECYKREGRVSNIKEFAFNVNSNFAISHTRWATHGKPCKENAHPHLSKDGRFALVHNGIIENYQEIKQELINNGAQFKSDTDTECIVELISQTPGDFKTKVKSACEKIKGSYALAVLDKETKSVIGIRNKSPLYFAKTENGYMLASDTICFDSQADKYYALNEGEVVIIAKHKVKFIDNEGKSFKAKLKNLMKYEQDSSKDGYEYFMEKEINEIPGIIKRLCSEYSNLDSFTKVKPLFENISNIKLIGCGTAYHACMYGSKVLEKALGVPCEAVIASEYKYSSPIIKENTLGIFVSQSGETADTIGCAELMKQNKAKTLAITNVSHSALASLCDEYLSVFAGKEIAVASTKAYVAQILMLYLLSKSLTKEYDLSDLENLSSESFKMIDIEHEVEELITKSTRVFFIGRQYDAITSLEAALKLKEISYKSAEGYPAGELKHGTIALIEQDTPVIVFATDRALFEKTMSACEEVRSRGAKVIVVTPKDFPVCCCDYRVDLPIGHSSEILSLISIIPFQVLSFKVSTNLGYNPDKPRNLAKSVTVE